MRDGERFENPTYNVLTVIANESYEDFAKALQSDYVEDGVISPPPIKNRGERVISNLRENIFKEKFEDIWGKLRIKSDYTSNIDSEALIHDCQRSIKDNLIIKRPIIDTRRGSLEITEKGIETKEKGSDPIKLLNINYSVPDLISRISLDTGLTRRTVSKILLGSEKLSEIFKNPEDFIAKVTYLIKDCRIRMEVENSTYFQTEEKYSDELFPKQIPSYGSNLVDAPNSLYDKVLCDRPSEKNFAEEMSKDEQVDVFSKLPDSYYINTPLGRYRPDWAMIYQRKRISGKSEDKIHLVCETKFGYVDISGTMSSIPIEQQGKITCALKHFSLIEGLKYSVAGSYQEFRESIP